MKHPIPDDALDDRLFFGGTSGSGKTYNAGGRVERLLAKGNRAVIIDPLGVWWGLRLLADGKTESGYDVVIFGGPHGDLPLTENAGTLLGETVAGMKESCILDLSALGTKAAERRFMLDFLTVLYRKTSGEPVHVVFDEADIFAPQSLVGDKDGPAPRLLGMMETVVRRGRVKGFIPWLISQRPAVLNKNVLSQADGLVAFKLTSSQDRDAIGAWVEGQADKGVWKDMYGDLATLERGQGVVWMPSRKVLEIVKFPPKKTFDSSRTPKRGEKIATTELKPIDLGKLKERLGKVEAETKANDPAALKKRIAELQKELSAKPGPAQKIVQSGPSQEKIDALVAAAQDAALSLGRHEGRVEYAKELLMRIKELEALGIKDLAKAIERLAAAIEKETDAKAPKVKIVARTVTTQTAVVPRAALNGHAKPAAIGNDPANESITRPQQKILNGLSWLASIGVAAPDKTQLALFVQVSPTSGGYFNNLGSLKTAGLIDYPSPGKASLTESGMKIAAPVETPPTTAELHASIASLLPAAKWKIVEELIRAYPDAVSKDELAARIGVSPTSGGYFNNLGSLKSLGVIDYPQKGYAVAQPILFLN